MYVFNERTLNYINFIGLVLLKCQFEFGHLNFKLPPRIIVMQINIIFLGLQFDFGVKIYRDQSLGCLAGGLFGKSCLQICLLNH